MPKLRDRIVHRVCNLLINTCATQEYRMYLYLVNYLGDRQLKQIREKSDARS